MSKRPNILVIMTEQHRGDCLRIEGHPVLQTPNIDSIAYGGVRFSRAVLSCGFTTRFQKYKTLQSRQKGGSF